MGTTTIVSPSGDPYLDGMLTGRRWDALTWSLPSHASDYGPGYTDQGALNNGFAPVNLSERQALQHIFDQLQSLIATPITFLGNNGLGDIRIANSANAGSAYSYYPDGTDSTGGDVFIGDYQDNFSPQIGNYGWHTLLHEVGHTLGLKHPFDPGDETAFADKIMPLDHDGSEFTVMTYKSGIGEGNGYTNETNGYPQSFMQEDIRALQELYGANYNSHSGDTTYKWDPNTGQEFIDGVAQPMPGDNRVFLSVWDGNGHDTYDFQTFTTDLDIDLTPGGWSKLSDAQTADLGLGHEARGNVFNAFLIDDDPRSLIEDVLGGSGNDFMVGNIADNAMWGGFGNDTIHGGDGLDRLLAGAGDDQLFGERGNDILSGGFGNDEFVYAPEAHDSSRDVITDFGVGNDHVVLAGVNVVKLGGNLALLSDGTLIAADGHVWSHSDFIFHPHF
jgi:serralysin